MNGTASSEKHALRSLLRDRRARFVAGLPASVRALAFRVLPRPLLERLPAGATISLYHAVGDEAPTQNLAAQLAGHGHPLVLPRLNPATGTMEFARWAVSDVLYPGAFRTLQPAPEAPVVAPDIIVAPLVGFDAALNRLGQGGGYYDRAFAAFPDALRIGLAWSAQQVESVPVDAHDRPLDIVVTEAALHERQDGS